MIRSGYIHGTGAALNVELGWVPKFVILINVTDGDKVHMCAIDKVVVFTSGGTTEIKAGEWIKGITSGAKVQIRDVILDSGTWAGGDAAGWLLFDEEQMTGTLQTENAQRYASEPGTTAAADNDVSIVVDVEFGVDIDTEVASVTGNAGCLAYVGDATTDPPESKGFTVGSTISEDGKLLAYIAIKDSPGENQGPLVNGVSQATLW